jgi:hypothetical protein
MAANTHPNRFVAVRIEPPSRKYRETPEWLGRRKNQTVTAA